VLEKNKNKKIKIIKMYLKNKKHGFYFYFYFFRGLVHCGPFIRSHQASSQPNVGEGLPKFDSKILIS